MAEPSTTRQNRWIGPSSTWRSYTKDERDLAASLDAMRSQDLSIHLYDAYAIKLRVRANRTGKDKSVDSNKSNFVPPDLWTAWPMPANQVPRDPYLPNVGGKGAWRRDEDVRPSAVLESALLATTTKVARERWRTRRWEWAGSKGRVDFKREGSGQDMVQGQEKGSEIDTSSPDRLIFSSQAIDALDQISSSDEDQTGNSDNEAEVRHRPVPLADDDRARQLLLPSIRHIISKADDLLEGLQTAHEAYAGNWNKRKPEDITTGEGTDTGMDTSQVPTSSNSRQSRKRARTSSVVSEASMSSAASTPSNGRRRPKMKQLRLRDWSDVLGMASLTGWDPIVVQRAAERCSQLFGEEMLFRTFYEGEDTGKAYFTEQLASGQEPKSSDGDEESVEEQDTKPHLERNESKASSLLVQETIIRCPVKDCPQHNKSYVRAKNMYHHVRQQHPEVDIKLLKKLESKRLGDRRGKWSRSSRRGSSSVVAGSSA